MFDYEFFPDPLFDLLECDKYASELPVVDSDLRFPYTSAAKIKSREDSYEDKEDVRSESGSEKGGENWSAVIRGDEDEKVKGRGLRLFPEVASDLADCYGKWKKAKYTEIYRGNLFYKIS